MPLRASCISIVLAFSCFPLNLIGQQPDQPAIDFRRQIQPLLARDCLACHGPDGQTRAADLRLDQEQSAKDAVIVAGQPDSSELIDRIFSDDPDYQMPPPESGHSLTNAEQQLIRDWIRQGAPWAKHWAFEPITSPAIPRQNPNWVINPIDNFVLANINSHDLQPAPTADKTVLLRRVYLDLIGLPPTPAQLDAFLNDSSDRAYENVVDQLLASRHYGEHQAASWLDAARYADTNGFQNDFVRNMWPWRDWVVNAFNQNLPYDEFIVQQIAGDLLPSPTQAQLVATGFNRNNRSVTEGGSIEEEWRVENCVDRVETTAATFLGLTMGCARCHDHKYDPISQREFFEFFAFFNNVDEKGYYNEARGNVGPQVKIVLPETEQKLANLEQRIKLLEQELTDNRLSVAQVRETLDAWRHSDDRPKQLPQPAYSLWDGGDSANTNSVFEFPGRPDQQQPDTMASPDELKLAADTAWSWSSWVRGDSRGAIFGKMDESNSYRGFDGLILEDGRLKVHLIHAWQSNAIAITTKAAIPKNGWTLITVTYAGNSKAGGLNVFFDGQPVQLNREVNSLTESIATEVPFKLGQRNNSAHLKGAIADLRFFNQQLDATQVSSLVRSVVAERAALVPESTLQADAPPLLSSDDVLDQVQRIVSAEKQQRLAQLKSEQTRITTAQPTTMVMREREGYRETYLLRRGQYDQPDKGLGPLFPAIPKTLPPLAENQPRNRLGLAKWMVDERNPLVARVAANRAWLQFFGRGLVHAPDNFGVQGTPPTHPELLNWLADDFRRHGWNLKRLHKLIVMSATYRQSSEVTERKLEADPDNRWLARGRRYRLSAEQIRDQALAISGLLNEKIGGPSVFPYQPDGLWKELAGGASNGPYKMSTGDDLYRRSLYTYRKRTVSHPTLATMDAPSWEICQVYRSQTNTPLQALALLNDTTYVEAARKLAERMIKESDSGEDANRDAKSAILRGFQLTHLRRPTDAELTTLLDGYRHYYQFYQANNDAALKLLGVGESEWDQTLAADRLAALTNVASVMLNRDEVISKH